MKTTHAECYGKMFPAVQALVPDTDITGKVFGYRVEHHGVIPQAPQLHVNSEAWDNCTRCSEFEACYRLAVGKLLMELAVRG